MIYTLINKNGSSKYEYRVCFSDLHNYRSSFDYIEIELTQVVHGLMPPALHNGEIKYLPKFYEEFISSPLYEIYKDKIELSDTLLKVTFSALTPNQTLFVLSIFRYFIELPSKIEYMYSALFSDIPFEYRILLCSLIHPSADKPFIYGNNHSVIAEAYFNKHIINYWEKLKEDKNGWPGGYNLYKTLFISVSASPINSLNNLRDKYYEYIHNWA